jgi:hypothetical protein
MQHLCNTKPVKEIKLVKQEEVEIRSDRLLTQIEPSLLELVATTAAGRGVSIGEFVRFSLIRGIHDMTGAHWNPLNPDGSKTPHG